MVTSWPSGSALPKPRKKRKRPIGKAAREVRRTTALVANVERNGIKFVPLAMRVVIPEQIDPPDADRCEECGHAVATLPVVGKAHVCRSPNVCHDRDMLSRKRHGINLF